MPCVVDAVMCCPEEPFGTEALSAPAVRTVAAGCGQLSVESLSRNGPQPKAAALRRGSTQLLLPRAVRSTPLDSMQGTEGPSQLQSSLWDRLMPLL